jgi:hypothetical protein
MLLAYLNAQRTHVIGILEGLSEADLRRPVLPSGWSCIELVQHLALDVERFWFRMIVAGEPEPADTPGNAWKVPAHVPIPAVLDLYQHEIGQANEIIDRTALDASSVWWPDQLWPTWRLANLRDVILHVMVETASHAGHADAARELIDGRTWMVLTD